MAFPGAELDNLLIKQSSTSMLLQALIVELLESGVLTRTNLDQMKQRALSYAAILNGHSGSGAQVAGARIERDLRMVFEMLSHR
jgi:hypothetical protein